MADERYHLTVLMDDLQQDIFIGRQPIFDGDLNITAYELLFRSDEQNFATVVDQNLATLGVLDNTFTEFGLKQLVGEHRAFININRDYLLTENPPPLPQDSVVLEILENIEIDDRVIKAVTDLAAQGYTIALDDFIFASEWEPLVRQADIIKIDVRQLSLDEIVSEINQLSGMNVELLAEKVESEAEFEQLRDMGFRLFQGYFLEEPKVIRGRRFSASQINILQLLETLQNPDVEISEIEKLISRDVALSYKILRLINSVAISLPHKVNSISQAIICLGLEEIRGWVSLLLLSTADNRPSELLRTALLRAKMCELLASENGIANSDTFFTLGLFSNLDALLQTSMCELLPDLPLSTEIKQALLGQGTELAQALQCVKACEQMNLPETSFMGLSRGELQTLYGKSIAWSLSVEKELSQKSVNPAAA